MSDILTTRDGLIGNSPRYTNHISPPYQRFLKDDAGVAINLTGVSPSAFTLTFVNQSNPLFVKSGTGTFTVVSPATQGLVSYQYSSGDVSDAGNWYAFWTVQLSGELSPRVFDPDFVSIILFPSVGGGGISVTIQDVNLTEVNGTAVSGSNPVPTSGPVTIADGANVAQGTTTDASSANTTIGLLKAIKAYLGGTLTVNATNPSVGTDGNAIPASSTLAGASDGTNLQPLQVESASNKNLRVGLYNGANEASVSAGGAVKVDNSAVTQPVSAASLPLPTGASTAAKQPALGTAGSASADVLSVQGIASMTPLKTDGSGVTQPVTDQHSNITTDYDTGAGTQTMTMYGVALPASGGSVAGGTSSNPLRTDPTGTTTQPVSGTVTANAGSGNFTVAQATGSNLHAVLDGGSAVIGSTTIQATSGTALSADQSNSELRVSNYVKTTTAGDTALTLGQATMANSLPVTMASNQGAIGSVVAQAVAGTALAADQSNSELRVSLYGKNSAAGDTAILVDSTGRVLTGRSTIAAYTLASTTTSGSTQNSSDITVGPYAEISIDINTTAQAGTSPTIQYFWERKGADGIYYVLWQSAVLTAATNTLSTSIGAGMAYNQSLGLTGRLRWVIGGSATPTFTHSLNIYGK